jgi:hypothetical protein
VKRSTITVSDETRKSLERFCSGAKFLVSTTSVSSSQRATELPSIEVTAAGG